MPDRTRAAFSAICMRTLFASAMVAFCLEGTAPAQASIAIGADSRVSLGDGAADVGCGDMQVDGRLDAGSSEIGGIADLRVGTSGVLDAGSSTLTVAGDFANQGTFDAGTSSVVLTDGCGINPASVTGANTFSTLEIRSGSGKEWRFEAGVTQTVLDSLVIEGAPGQLLRLRSTVPGQEAFTNLQGTHSIGWMDVDDNHATGRPIGRGSASAFHSAKGQNAEAWFVPPPPIPTAEDTVLLLFATLLALSGLTVLSRHRSGHPSMKVRIRR